MVQDIKAFHCKKCISSSDIFLKCPSNIYFPQWPLNILFRNILLRKACIRNILIRKACLRYILLRTMVSRNILLRTIEFQNYPPQKYPPQIYPPQNNWISSSELSYPEISFSELSLIQEQFLARLSAKYLRLLLYSLIFK